MSEVAGFDPRTERARRIYERLAPRYDRSMRLMERWFFGRWRPWVAERAEGEVLEVGVGTGVDLEHLAGRGRLTGVDLSEPMLAVARRRAEALGVEVDLHRADAQALPFGDARFDSVVFSLVLCTVPDEARAIAEAHRVLRPGGRLLSLEHVRSPNPMVRFGQALANPLSRRLGGDELLREPLETVSAAGFAVEELERGRLGFVEALSARKPVV